jgi:predicted MFS family arabinose efflux permease
VAFGLSFIAIALFVTNLASFYALYALMALCGGGTIAVTFAKLLTLRFVKHRGLALGLAMAGTGLCSVLVQPFAAWVVEHYGWRAGYVALGLLPLLVGFPASWLFVHDEPAPVAHQAAGSSRSDAVEGTASARGGAVVSSVPADATAPTAGVPWQQAIRDRRFWAMGLAMALCSAAMTSLIATFVPMLEDRGYDKGTAALMAGSFGIAVIGGRVLVGFLIDRWWAPAVGMCFFVPAALGIAVLALVPLSAPATIACIALAGLAAGAEVDLLAYLVSRYFGQRDFGRIYSGQYLFFALGPGVLVPLFGALRAATQGYEAPLLATAAGVIACGLLLLSMGRYPRAWA